MAKVVMITGSSRGVSDPSCPPSPTSLIDRVKLGRTLCTLVAGRDEPIILLATSRGAINVGVRGVNPGTIIEYPRLDVLDKESIFHVRDYVKKTYGRVDVLVNNAGTLLDQPDNRTFGSQLVKEQFEMSMFRLHSSWRVRVFLTSGRLSQCRQCRPFPRSILQAADRSRSRRLSSH